MLNKLLILVIISLLFLHVNSFPQNITKDVPAIIKNFEGNWKYRWGKSPADENGKYLWININIDSSWNTINRPSDISSLPGSNELWIKIKPENYNLNTPALFISRVEKIFEVYVDSKRIYSFGDFTRKNKIPLMGFAWHLIKLPENISDKTITFHLRSDYQYIGIIGDVKIGPADVFISNIIKKDLSKTIIGIVFIGTGIILFICLFFLKKLKPFVGLILFQISIGTWTLANSDLTQILIYHPAVLFYADHLALFTSAIGFFLFASETVDIKFRQNLRRLSVVHLCYFVFAVLNDAIMYPAHRDTVGPFLILTTLTSILLIYFLIISALKGNREARILLLALGIYTAFVLADILNYFNNVMIAKGVYEMQYAHYGGICFYFLLCYIIILRYITMNKLSNAAREEVLKNQQIAFEAVQNEKAAKEKFTQNLILTQENERKRIAGELHDSLGQELLIIKNRAILGLENKCDDNSRLNHLNEISSLSTQAINEVRQITYNLRPYQLDRVGLTKALQSLITRLESSSEIKFKMFVDNIDNLFSKDDEINIYRIVQEGINNIIKHSSASSAVLMVSKEDGNVCITIEDNGKGFEKSNKEKAEKSGFGLTGINERARILGGTCEIISAPGRGTVVKIELPIFNREINLCSS